MDEVDKKQSILVVDDTSENIDLLVGILENEYNVKVAINGERALKVANAAERPDLILLDVMMPGMDGFEVCRRLKDNPYTRYIPVIFLTAMQDAESERKGFEVGAVDFVTKPINPPTVLARIKTHLNLYNQNQTLEEMVYQRTAELRETRLEVIKYLGKAAEFKDNDTGMHVVRMSLYVKVIAAQMGLEKREVELIYQASPMHDVGKIGIPDYILKKTGKLDEDEWEIMRKHTVYGYDIFEQPSSQLLKTAKLIALTHHEKWDGTGYPNGIKGEEIPLAGRIAAIADVYDALVSERPYKNKWTHEDAVEEIKRQSGVHFDPRIVDVFLACSETILQIKNQYQ